MPTQSGLRAKWFMIAPDLIWSWNPRVLVILRDLIRVKSVFERRVLPDNYCIPEPMEWRRNLMSLLVSDFVTKMDNV